MTPNFDLEIVNSRIEKIRANTSYLKEFVQLSYEQFMADPKNKVVCERLLQISIEAMIDTASHIIAVCGFQEPQEYREVFLILGQRGVFDPEFTKRLVDMVGLRNRLVHVYLEIDYKRLYSFIKENLGDFDKFVKIILSYVSKQ